MKKNKILFLTLFLIGCSSSDYLMLSDNKGNAAATFFVEGDDFFPGVRNYTYVPGENTMKKIELKNTKIELEIAIKRFDYVPIESREKRMLKRRASKRFLNDFNKLTLVTEDITVGFPYEINIYSHGKLIAVFGASGTRFYDRKNKLIYETKEELIYDRKNNLMYREKESLLKKHWFIEEGDNMCH